MVPGYGKTAIWPAHARLWNTKDSEPKALCFRDDDMKRTQRIEITRYRRTITVIQGSENAPDRDAELFALEIVANELEVLLPTDEVETDAVVKVVLLDELPTIRRWSSFDFRKWLRQRL